MNSRILAATYITCTLFARRKSWLYLHVLLFFIYVRVFYCHATIMAKPEFIWFIHFLRMEPQFIKRNLIAPFQKRWKHRNSNVFDLAIALSN